LTVLFNNLPKSVEIALREFSLFEIFALRQRGLRHWIASLCVGGGEVVAMAIEAEMCSHLTSEDSQL